MDKPKRKQPSKADLINQAIALGITDTAGDCDGLTVKELRAMIKENKELRQLEPDIPEITEPNCGHIFRKVREIHRTGNIVVNICNICGWRETVG